MTLSKEVLDRFWEMVETVHRDGGEVKITVDEKWRTIHFLPRMDHEFIAERLAETVRVLAEWHPTRRKAEEDPG